MTLANPEDDQYILYVSGCVPEARRLWEACALATERLKNNAAKDKACWDTIIKPQKFAINDHILMHHENKLSLEFNWKGLFKVIDTNPETDIYKLQDLNGQVYSSWVHTNCLRPIHVGSNQLTDLWYDPTAVCAAERRHLQAAGRITLLSEDVQHSGEGILS